MHPVPDFVIAMVTAPDVDVARALVRAALTQRLAACANLVPQVESHYWWQGKLEQSNEVLVIMKTTAAHVHLLEKCVSLNHPYDTPEFIVLSIPGGSKKYLNWIAESVSQPESIA